jgi:hypothetical protein
MFEVQTADQIILAPKNIFEISPNWKLKGVIRVLLSFLRLARVGEINMGSYKVPYRINPRCVVYCNHHTSFNPTT